MKKYSIVVLFVLGISFGPSAQAQVVINEFLASNSATIADQNGEFNDVIELYNAGQSAFPLQGYHLSDTISNLVKYTFPDTTLAPGAYLIVWADRDLAQVGLHADFRLRKEGEEIYFSDPQLNIVDSLNFDLQITDVSKGRCANGIGFFSAQTPTLGAVNDCSLDAAAALNNSLQLEYFPNPVREQLRLRLNSQKPHEVEVLDLWGRKMTVAPVKIQQGEALINVQQWAPGMYFLHISGQLSGRFIVR